jgi:hypothetical protein
MAKMLLVMGLSRSPAILGPEHDLGKIREFDLRWWLATPFSPLRQKFGLIACLDRSIAPAKPMRPQARKKCGHLEPWKKKSYGA